MEAQNETLEKSQFGEATLLLLLINLTKFFISLPMLCPEGIIIIAFINLPT